MENGALKDFIQATIKQLGLNLRGKTVLTEAANGPYSVTPLIAGMAGAAVIAYGQTTAYGKVTDVFAELEDRIRACSITGCRLVEKLAPEDIGQADIITNSGHLRPLDEEKLKYIKTGAVISLMYEAWELRETDIDLAYCRTRKISVGGLNERHPAVGVFESLGDMAAELITRSGLALRGEKLVLMCNNEFGPYIAKTLLAKGVELGVLAVPTHRERYPEEATWLMNDPGQAQDESFRTAKGLLFTAYPFDQKWISEYGPYPVSYFQEHFPDAKILRFAGDIDTGALDEAGIPYYPPEVKSGHMGILPSDVGYEPVIRLQAGGLRVGQAMLEEEFDVNGQHIGSLVAL
ncbi:MAG: hypothetical protein K8I00_03315 [Candidatus Omnitrophica bacterium]|nr:hypothetical protein [Candidatus Omnitrophota bacterium]